METLTVAALTALHSLCHRIGPTPDEQEAIAPSESPHLGPQIWRQSVRFLEEADAADPGSRIDLGFSSLIFRWLGIENEATCVERHGLGVEQALSRDCGSLAAVVRASPERRRSAPGTDANWHRSSLASGQPGRGALHLRTVRSPRSTPSTVPSRCAICRRVLSGPCAQTSSTPAKERATIRSQPKPGSDLKPSRTPTVRYSRCVSLQSPSS